MSEEIIRETIEETVGRTRVHVFCDTCHEEFLNTSIMDYMRLHDWKEPEKWFVEAGIHWCKHPDHQIIAILPPAMLAMGINEIWIKKQQNDGLTREQMLEGFLRYREQVKNKPI